MTPTTIQREVDVLQAFLKTFDFPGTFASTSDPFHDLGKPKRPHALRALDNRLPAFGAMGVQVDAAARFVRAFEEFLNRPEVFCAPIQYGCGPAWSNTYGRSERTSYTLCIERVMPLHALNEKWRVMLCKTIAYGPAVPEDTFGGESQFERKPWLEASLVDRLVTLEYLSGLVRELTQTVARLAHIAEQRNPAALIKLDELASSMRAER